jgi:quercetin dioxygenase-like cupin family protein
MGEWIEDPVLRQRLRFERLGDVLTLDVEAMPKGGVGKHFHPSMEERWTVVRGKVRFLVGKEKVIPAAGETLTVPAGVRHAYENVGEETAILRMEGEPALDLEPFLIDAAQMNREGLITRSGIPKSFGGLLRGAVFLDRYRETTVLIFPPPFPPPPLQRLVFGPLARLGRRRAA